MLDNKKIREIAMARSALDIGCLPEDFLKTEPVVVDAHIGEGAHVYYKEPVTCNLVSYGNNVVASVKPEFREMIEEYVRSTEFFHLYSTPNILPLNEKFAAKGHAIRHMAYYYLPDVNKVKRLGCPYELRSLYPGDFKELYTDEWHNALCADRPHLDMLCVGAYDGNRLIGMAGCSADCADMWQIGIDVLPEYRRQGVASALTSNIAVEIFERGKVPYYCCAWANIPSAGNAIKSGFMPGWVEMTVKPIE